MRRQGPDGSSETLASAGYEPMGWHFDWTNAYMHGSETCPITHDPEPPTHSPLNENVGTRLSLVVGGNCLTGRSATKDIAKIDSVLILTFFFLSI